MSDVHVAGAFSVYTGDILKMAENFEGGPKVAQRELLKGMRLATADTRDNVRQIAPYKSGKLRSNIDTRVRQEARHITGEVKILGSKVPYAYWVDQGRGPVVPKHKKVLRFWVDGEQVFTKFVKAFPGYHFMERGLKASEGQINRAIDSAADRIARYLGGYRI